MHILRSVKNFGITNKYVNPLCQVKQFDIMVIGKEGLIYFFKLGSTEYFLRESIYEKLEL